MKTTSFLAFAAAVLLSGCAGITSERKEKLVDRLGIDVIGSPADRMHVVIKDDTSKERVCKGPGPDMATTASAGVNMGVSGAAAVPGAGTIGENASRGALDLGGRSPTVLLAREFFYRACELTMNMRPDQETALSIYKMTLDSIERIAALQNGAVGAAAQAAAPPPSAAGLPPNLINQPAPAPGQ